MLDLAVHNSSVPVTIKSISHRQGISEYYLEQLFAPLRKAKLITSIRGAQGGYVLAKDPKDITVLDIMNILEGPVDISDCIDGTDCTNIDMCATRVLWKKIKNSIDSVMASVTLQDMLDDYESFKGTPINESVFLK